MPKVLIAGGGLVGALNAVFFANRGWEVDVLEQRPDIRRMEHVPGRSINLALSHRGKASLEAVGLKDFIAERGVPLFARMVHDPDGVHSNRQPYGQPGEHIVSINRRHLNEVMITEAEKFENVHFHFEHKIKRVDLRKRTLIALSDGNELRFSADLILACDGAYSAVRRSLMAYPRFDFSQEYIAHGYLELNIPPKNNGFVMDPNVFHLWPRGDFTLIALANIDFTFTVTVFAPFEIFENELLQGDEKRIAFFNKHFPDALQMMSADHVNEVFNKAGKASPLVSVKCKPHSFEGFVVLMGDAAHAMVPFYGQGMNAVSEPKHATHLQGFEDCLVLHNILNDCGDNIADAVRRYGNTRYVDAHVINDLAMYNYNELKHLVNQTSYKLRKRLDLRLNRWLPKLWIPLYSMVTFSSIPYSQVVEHRRMQDRILSALRKTIVVLAILTGCYTLVRNRDCMLDWANHRAHDLM